MADQPVWRAGLEKLVADDPALRVGAAVGDLTDLPADAVYDLVVLDVAKPDAAALELVIGAAPFGHLLVSADWTGRPGLMAAIRAGARGCVSRLAEQDAVREAMRVTAQGGFYLCPRLADRFPAELPGSPAEDQGGLAPREVETLRWIASGFTHAQIATRMGLSQATVNTYAKRIRAKLNANNKAELTRRAIELGHLTPVGPS
ncbi:LuxR C-terminal-related transcriptional regulator [Actinoplanes sp. NPDC051494]|uniref:LuxR C-terminal-related transcriptional regulator n=1 Tax=Actinoplanes sp. NPDC051494 TaxID=3363907 RepID=UPI0037B03DEA